MKSINFRVGNANNGYLTIFLALSLSVILSLCFTLIEGARTNGARFMAENALDIGMDSILAEYHRELLEQYDVFFIDASYGTNLPSVGKVIEHLENYVMKNLSIQDVRPKMRRLDLYGLSVQSMEIGELSIATDEFGKVFRKQAIQYMKDRYGLNIPSRVSKWSTQVEEYELNSPNLTRQRQKTDSKIQKMDGVEMQVDENETVKIDIENPSDSVNYQRNKGILLLAMRDTDQLSNAAIVKSNTLSQRSVIQGVGPVEEKREKDSVSDRILFDEYIFEKSSYYGEELEKSHMKYQIEYLLSGKDNDLDNLKSVATRLFLLREAANTAYLLGDSGKRALITSLAATISAVTLLPELQTLLEYSILFSWAFIETIYDVRSLFDDGKVPIVKTDDTWHTDLDLIFSGSLEGDDSKSTEGLSYEEYLRIFLSLTDLDTKTIRFLDMVEADIKKTDGNSNFRIDGCLDGMRIEANFVSRYGNAFILQRKCCYE